MELAKNDHLGRWTMDICCLMSERVCMRFKILPVLLLSVNPECEYMLSNIYTGNAHCRPEGREDTASGHTFLAGSVVMLGKT